MTMHDVLVIGETLMDVVMSTDSASEHVGGSPANVALGLGRRGVDVALLTQIGADRRGGRIREHLLDSGVTVLPESTSLVRTSSAIAHLADDGSASYEFHITWPPLPCIAHTAARVIHTGSIATFLDPGAASVLSLVADAPADIVTFDPNIRPALVGTHEKAFDKFVAIASRAQLVKMSDEDADWLYPGADTDAVLDAVLKLGPDIAVVTLGSEGAVLARSDDRVRVSAPEVQAVDTIGAGDTFMASLLMSLIATGLPQSRVDLAAMGVAAARAAAITVSRAGADLPWAAELAD